MCVHNGAQHISLACTNDPSTPVVIGIYDNPYCNGSALLATAVPNNTCQGISGYPDGVVATSASCCESHY